MSERESPFAHLRPTTVPEMLDRAYCVAARFWPYLWGGGIVYGADHLLKIFLSTTEVLPSGDPWRVAATLGMALLGDFAAAVALLAAFQGLIFPLRPVAARAIFRTALRKFPGYFLSHLAYVITVAFCGLMAWQFMRTGLGDESDRTILLLAGVLAGITPVLAFRLCLAPIACLIEDGTPLASFRRSWQLTAAWPRGVRLRKDRPLVRLLITLALPVVLALLIFVAGLALGYYGLNLPLPVRGKPAGASLLLDGIAFVATAAALPLLWVGLMSIYIEYRMRLEALDFYLRLRELSRDNAGDYPL